MVIPGRAALEQGQDLLGGVMVATSQETAVTSEDLKRDHGAETMVYTYWTNQISWEWDLPTYMVLGDYQKYLDWSNFVGNWSSRDFEDTILFARNILLVTAASLLESSSTYISYSKKKHYLTIFL